MQLTQLLRPLDLKSPSFDVDITLVTDKSREVIPGALFVAYPGVSVDGAKYIPDALARGALAVVSESPIPPELIAKHLNVVFMNIPDGRAALAQLAAAWHRT